ncbi:MAG: hypothetical protein COT00_02215, partial [Candidatus Omnitrophica bacterium CG07_land_8_20_14_0_80_50_8]
MNDSLKGDIFLNRLFRHKKANILKAKAGLAAVVISFAFFTVQENIALALPQGYSVESGNVSFDSQDPNSLTITASDKAIINFNSFSIAPNETVKFVQPFNSSSVLSRVTGNTATDIYGSLIANGQLIFVNTNGITFHENSNIQVSSLIASTLNIQSAMYLNNQMTFEKQFGSNPGKILNEATIQAADGGHIALLSESVQNKGTLIANKGSVVLAGGEKSTISFDNQGIINLVIDKGLSQSLPNAVQNQGTLKADGGKVILNAKTLNQTLDTLVNNSGIIEANQLVERNGVIEIVSSGAIESSGTVSASNGTINVKAGQDLKVQGQYNAKGGEVNFESGRNITTTGPISTQGTTTFKAVNNINVNFNVT